MNVHKRCEKNVANNCGINTKSMAKLMAEIGISPGNVENKSKKKTVSSRFTKFGSRILKAMP